MRLFPRTVVALSSGLCLAACDVCVEPTYAGAATDEAYLSLRDAEKSATTDDARAALFTAPAEGAEASLGGDPPTFEWTSGLTASAPKPAPPAPGRFRWSELLLSTAHAHGAPMAGPGHLVRLEVQGLACPVQHFTSRTSWSVSAPEWRRFTGQQGQTLRVEVLSAYFSANRVTEGPFKPGSGLALKLTP